MRIPNRVVSENRSSERGTTIVESAIFLTAFFMFMFGVMEAGRFLNVQQVLTNAAREGARFAIAPETAETCPGAGVACLPTVPEIQAVVNNFLASSRVYGATVTVNQNFQKPPADEPFPNTVYTLVTVTSDYDVLTVPFFFNALEFTLRGESLMRNETSP